MKVIRSIMSTMKYKYDLFMKVIRSIMRTKKYKYDILMKVIRSIMWRMKYKYDLLISLLGLKQLIKQILKSNSKEKIPSVS
jgi:hypothetical protein